MTKHFILIICLFLAGFFYACQAPPNESLLVENLRMDRCQEDGKEIVSLSWTINASLPRGIKQEAYRVLIATDTCLLEQERVDVWDSGKIRSDKMFDISYLGKQLHNDSSYYAKIRLWTNKGSSSWSPVEVLRLPAWDSTLSKTESVNRYDAYDLVLGDLLEKAKTLAQEKYANYAENLFTMPAEACWAESYLLDNRELYINWMDKVAAAQSENGCMPVVVQQEPLSFLDVAHMLYMHYAEIKAIEKHFPTMEKWMDYLWSTYGQNNHLMAENKQGKTMLAAEDVVMDGKQYQTSSTLISTAIFYRMCVLMEYFSKLLDYPHRSDYYLELATQIRAAYNTNFYRTETQHFESNTVTANLLSLSLGLCDEKDQPVVFRHIEKSIAIDHFGKAACGSFGNQYLLRILSTYGRADLAYRIASTQPEASGDYILWFFESLCGVKSLEPGFGQFNLDAVFPPGIYFAQTRMDTRMGRVSSSWIKTVDDFVWQVNVPANTSARLRYPATSVKDIYEDGRLIERVEGIHILGVKNENVVMLLESGDYYFSSKLSRFNPKTNNSNYNNISKP